MNIFVLDKDIKKSAKYHVDKHVVKMPLETAQLLCSAHHVVGSDLEIPYKLSHKNHPCSVWVRKSLSNYMWLVEFGLELCYEYTNRYGKIHKCQEVISWCKTNAPDIPNIGMTDFAQAVPDELKSSDAIQSYRNYYKTHKQHLFSWKNAEQPNWL